MHSAMLQSNSSVGRGVHVNLFLVAPQPSDIEKASEILTLRFRTFVRMPICVDIFTRVFSVLG